MNGSGQELCVATYNMHGGIGGDRRYDLGRISEVIAEIDPDVIALQEVGDIRGRAPSGDHAAELGELLDRTVLYHPTLRTEGAAYGNALLTRLAIDGSRSYDLSVKSREPRGCIRADLRLGGELIHVFALHLGLSRAEQRLQAGMLLGADILRDAAVAWPLVVVGDFNFWFPGPIARAVKRALVDGAVAAGSRAATFPSRWPMLRLDRIYVDGAWEVLEVKVHRSKRARWASDHLPLVARLRLHPEATRLPTGATPAAVKSPAP